jgi:hypothetical protein
LGTEADDGEGLFLERSESRVLVRVDLRGHGDEVFWYWNAGASWPRRADTLDG